MNKISRCLLAIFLFSNLFSEGLIIKSDTNNPKQKILTIDSTINVDIKNKISEGYLPISSTFYQISDDYDIQASVTYDIASTEYLDDINIWRKKFGAQKY